MVAAREQTSLSTVLSMGTTHECRHPQFLCCVLWTDKAVFTRRDVHSLQILHIWATKNPRAIFTPYSSTNLASTFWPEW